MTKLSQIILEKIKMEHRQPLPPWVFKAKRILIWSLVILSVIAASLFLGALIAGFITLEWPLATRWPGGQIGFLWDTVAWLFVIGVIVALIGGILFFRLTRRGYRYGIAVIAIVIALSSLTAGALLVFTPVPLYLHEWYDVHFPRRVDVARFHAPEEGRLLGKITSKEGDIAYLEAVDGQTWRLVLFENKSVEAEDLVEVFGEIVSPDTFAAMAVRAVPPYYFVQGLPPVLRTKK